MVSHAYLCKICLQRPIFNPGSGQTTCHSVLIFGYCVGENVQVCRNFSEFKKKFKKCYLISLFKKKKIQENVYWVIATKLTTLIQFH